MRDPDVGMRVADYGAEHERGSILVAAAVKPLTI
jgi:hypothetical protein